MCAASLRVLSSWDVSELGKLLNLLQIVNDLHLLITAHKLCISLQNTLGVLDKKTLFTCIRYDMCKRLLDCQVVPPGCFQRVSGTRTGEWEEELLDTAEHTWILKPKERDLVCGKHISWLEVTGRIVSAFLRSSLTVRKESCSSSPHPPHKKQSCLTCE